MTKSRSATKVGPGVVGTVGVSVAMGALFGVGALVGYGVVVTKCAAANLAARTAVIGALGGLGGTTTSLIMRPRQRIPTAREEAS